MNTVKKYRLVGKKDEGKYRDYTIKGLQMAYYKPEWGDGKLMSFGGACGLLKNENYPGYCSLCMTYHSFNDDKVGNTNLPHPVYVVEFSPLYNEKGQMILVKYNADEVFASIDRGGYKVFDDEYDFTRFHIAEATITFWKHGAFKEEKLNSKH